MQVRRHALWLAVVATVVLGCDSTPGETGEGDEEIDASFGAGGKADYGTIAEGSPEAIGVLRLVNEAGHDVLHDEVGLGLLAVKHILAYRCGADSVCGGSGADDDQVFDTLAELDAVPYVGPASLNKLLAYARMHDYVVYTGPAWSDPLYDSEFDSGWVTLAIPGNLRSRNDTLAYWDRTVYTTANVRVRVTGDKNHGFSVTLASAEGKHPAFEYTAMVDHAVDVGHFSLDRTKTCNVPPCYTGVKARGTIAKVGEGWQLETTFAYELTRLDDDGYRWRDLFTWGALATLPLALPGPPPPDPYTDLDITVTSDCVVHRTPYSLGFAYLSPGSVRYRLSQESAYGVIIAANGHGPHALAPGETWEDPHPYCGYSIINQRVTIYAPGGPCNGFVDVNCYF